MKPALLLVGHGSRDSEGTEEFRALVDMFRRHDPERIVECGFLEFARPIIQDGIDRCVERGAETLVVLPGMLMAAGHTKNDIPSEIHDARQRYPNVLFHYGRHLHFHAKILQLCRLRIEEAEAQAPPGERRNTLLLIVGRGSSDPDANAEVVKLAQMLAEGLGLGWATACFIGVTAPLLPEALERCQRMGYGRIIVFSFFLFTGVLEKQIRAMVEHFAAAHSQTEFLYAGYLRGHQLLFDVFAERAEEALHCQPTTNCELKEKTDLRLTICRK